MDQTEQPRGNGGSAFWQRMQMIDQRVIYAVLFVILIVCVSLPSKVPITPTSNARKLYQAVEACPDDEVILIMSMWGYGSQGENWPQLEALVYHCLIKGKKFAMIGGDMLTVPLYNQIVENRVAAFERETGRKIVYGRDWINLGWRMGASGPGATIAVTYKALAKDIPTYYGNRDYKNNDLSKMPIMSGIRNAGDFYMIVEISYHLEGVYCWIGLIKQEYPQIRVAGMVVAIIAPDAYPYVDSGQLVALIDGYRGAAEYEKLIGFEKEGRGHRQANAQTGAHIFIFVLLVLGNIGYLMSRRRR